MPLPKGVLQLMRPPQPHVGLRRREGSVMMHTQILGAKQLLALQSLLVHPVLSEEPWEMHYLSGV